MSILLLIVLAGGLATDAFAVSISNGMCYRNIGGRQVILTALTFGAFQGAMPVLGYYGGRLAEDAIASLDHWIALVLLCFIGGSMAMESLKEMKSSESCPAVRELNVRTLLVQGVATSIDALAVGVSLAALRTNIVQAAGLIAVVTFAVCLFGAVLGKRFGLLLGQKAKLCGGLVLIWIGLRIFAEHTLG
ncbi:manganese efflux pump MntP [Bacilliculturomica massiliensis]|uniref:manganese efflux pump MntP n=1 Tax=Bacilliculturomica massiliensis TaxID=1917867 RepID=UPI0010321090|nr:manganese efflux pump MntP family protein [Bacilliculturomica massiliensis]